MTLRVLLSENLEAAEVALRVYPNSASKISFGKVSQSSGTVYAFSTPITLKPSRMSSEGGELRYQLRAITSTGNSLILRAPRTGNLQLKVPYTKDLYLDVIDAEGNYRTMEIDSSIRAPRPIYYEEFEKIIVNILRDFNNENTEEELEDLFYELKNMLDAYYYGIVIRNNAEISVLLDSVL